MKDYYKIMLDSRNRIKLAADCLSGKFIGADYEINEDLTSDLSTDVTKFNNKFVPVYLNNHPGKSRNAAELNAHHCGLFAKKFRKEILLYVLMVEAF